jgi:hypothetical protein
LIDCKNKEDKIISYLENELNADERLEFEKELNSNSSLKAECSEVKEMLKSLNRLPKVTAQDDFIVSLNNKIDAHEKNINKSWKSFFSNIFSSSTISSNGAVSSKISAIAISAVCIFCIMLYSGIYNMNQETTLSKSSSLDKDNVQVADADSLDNNDK